jgi:Domain of unknown function (DUF6378)
MKCWHCKHEYETKYIKGELISEENCPKCMRYNSNWRGKRGIEMPLPPKECLSCDHKSRYNCSSCDVVEEPTEENDDLGFVEKPLTFKFVPNDDAPAEITNLKEVCETLAQREKTHGDFSEHARVSQSLKIVMENHLCLHRKVLTAQQKEALEMIFHKIARILCGDPNYIDHWRDIAGYATLVERSLNENTGKI